MIYNATSVLLEVISGLPGDYNNNGTVDAADYTVWRNHLGELTSLANDDTAGVDLSDYTRWKTHYGSTLPGAGSGALAAVPEPASAILLLTLGMTQLVARRWNRAVRRLRRSNLTADPSCGT